MSSSRRFVAARVIRYLAVLFAALVVLGPMSVASASNPHPVARPNISAQACFNNIGNYVKQYDPSFWNQGTETANIFHGNAAQDFTYPNNVYMASIACHESLPMFYLHSQNGQYYGWYSQSIYDMNHWAAISFSYYWNGGVDYAGVWLPNYDWQNWTVVTYIAARYNNSPYQAYQHEVADGWF